MSRKTRTTRKPRPDIPCGYCFEEWATCYDHIIPITYGGSNDIRNLMPACHLCNALASGKVFDTIEQKREFITAARAARSN